MRQSILLLATLAVATSGCGLLVDALSDATATDVDVDVLPFDLNDGEETRLKPLRLRVKLDQDNPFFQLVAKHFGPVLAAHVARLDKGGEPLLGLDIPELTVESETPLIYSVAVRSRDGVVLPPPGVDHDQGGSAPRVDDSERSINFGDADSSMALSEGIDACAFVVTSETTSLELAQKIMACLEAVVRLGIPNELEITITVTPEDPAEDTAPFNVSHRESGIVALTPTDVDCFARTLKIDSSVVDNWEVIAFEDMKLVGTGRWFPIEAAEFDPACLEVPEDQDLEVWGYATFKGPEKPDYAYGEIDTDMVVDETHEFLAVGGDGGATPGRIVRDDYGVVFQNELGGVASVGDIDAFMETVLTVTRETDLHELRTGEVHRQVTGCYVVYGRCPREGELSFKITSTARFRTDQ